MASKVEGDCYCTHLQEERRRDSSVGIVTKLWSEQPTNPLRFPATTRDLPFLSSVENGRGTRRIKSNKNPNDPIGNQTRGLPACRGSGVDYYVILLIKNIYYKEKHSNFINCY
jgi:hypothetical protein